MRGRVDPAGQTADYRQARVGDLIGQFFSGLSPVMGGAARADDANGVIVALLEFAATLDTTAIPA